MLIHSLPSETATQQNDQNPSGSPLTSSPDPAPRVGPSAALHGAIAAWDSRRVVLSPRVVRRLGGFGPTGRWCCGRHVGHTLVSRVGFSHAKLADRAANLKVSVLCKCCVNEMREGRGKVGRGTNH